MTFNFTLIAQIKSKYSIGFEKGFKEGYCYNRNTYNCLTPITPLTPLPRINENENNYLQGYNRGFEYGNALKISKDAMENNDYNLNKNIPKFNEYVSQNSIQAARDLAVFKQRKYEFRSNWIDSQIKQLNEILILLFNPNSIPSDFEWKNIRNDYWQMVENYGYTLETIDLSQDHQFVTIQYKFKELENYFYNGYNQLIAQRQNSDTFSSDKATNAKIYVYRGCGFVGMFTKVKLYSNGEYKCKIPICSGYNFTITEPGRIKLVFKGGGCFTSKDVYINVTSGEKEYYVRYDIGDTDCSYTLVSPSVGLLEYSRLKHKDILGE